MCSFASLATAALGADILALKHVSRILAFSDIATTQHFLLLISKPVFEHHAHKPDRKAVLGCCYIREIYRCALKRGYLFGSGMDAVAVDDGNGWLNGWKFPNKDGLLPLNALSSRLLLSSASSAGLYNSHIQFTGIYLYFIRLYIF